MTQSSVNKIAAAVASAVALVIVIRPFQGDVPTQVGTVHLQTAQVAPRTAAQSASFAVDENEGLPSSVQAMGVAVQIPAQPESKVRTESDSALQEEALRERELLGTQLIARTLAAMDATLSNETPDRIATQQLSTTLGESLTAGGSTLADTRCSRTLCRVEIAANESGSERQAFRAISGVEAFANSDGFYHRAPDGGLVVYLSREGFRLPRS